MSLPQFAKRLQKLEAKIPRCHKHGGLEVVTEQEFEQRRAEVEGCADCQGRDVLWIVMGRLIVHPERPVSEERKQTTQWDDAQRRVNAFLAELP